MRHGLRTHGMEGCRVDGPPTGFSGRPLPVRAVGPRNNSPQPVRGFEAEIRLRHAMVYSRGGDSAYGRLDDFRVRLHCPGDRFHHQLHVLRPSGTALGKAQTLVGRSSRVATPRNHRRHLGPEGARCRRAYWRGFPPMAALRAAARSGLRMPQHRRELGNGRRMHDGDHLVGLLDHGVAARQDELAASQDGRQHTLLRQIQLVDLLADRRRVGVRLLFDDRELTAGAASAASSCRPATSLRRSASPSGRPGSRRRPPPCPG